MRQMILATFGAAALTLLGGMGEVGSADAHERRGSRSSEYISVDLYPYGSVTYANHSRDRHAYYYGHRHYRDHPPYGHAYGHWKKHHKKHWKHHHRHDRYCRH